MISCTLGDKKYTVDFVNGRTMRNIGKAMDAWEKFTQISAQREKDSEMKLDGVYEKPLDTMVSWFCADLFKGQFSADEFYDNYPSDRMVHDITMAIFGVYTSATNLLNEFPTIPTAEE